MPKPPKPEPVKITSREGLEAVVADDVRNKIRFARVTAQMEEEISVVQKKYQGQLLKIADDIQRAEAGIYVYCQAKRAELFADKKSLDLMLATIGFELNPFSVDKRVKKDTWEDVATRLEAVEWGAQYLTPPVSGISKVKLIADREKLTAEQCAEVGIKFEQEEQFFIRPKSDVAEETTKTE